LKNAGTSRVIYLLMLGVDTPIALAQELRIAPPSVIEQLHRLARIHLIRVGKKTGKLQHYVIDWKKLIEVSIRRSFRILQTELREQEAGITIERQFLSNQGLREFVGNYIRSMMNELPRTVLLRSSLTFADLLDDMHSTIVAMMADHEIKKMLQEQSKRKPHLRSLFSQLDLWMDSALQVSTISRRVFIGALGKSGFVIE
jgi:hypothetical protein